MLSWILAFTDAPIPLVTVPGLMAWFAIVERARTMRAALLWTGLLGIVGTGGGYHWLADTIELFGGIGAPWSWMLVALFGAVGMLHGWVFVIVYRSMLQRGRRLHPLSIVILMVAVETLPIRLFPWMVGHGVVDIPPLVQAAEWGGVPGVSFVVCCLIVSVYEWIRWALVQTGPPARPRAALVTFLIGLALYGVGMVRYGQIRAEDRDASRHLRVAIVQANIGSLRKRGAENGTSERLDSIAAYYRGTLRAVASDPELIVWPETAITDAVPLDDTLQTNVFMRGRGYGFLNELGETRGFLVGLYERITPHETVAPRRRPADRYNVAAMRQPGGVYAEWTPYRKVYLIPFGEYMPLGLFQDRLPQNFKMVAGALPQPLLEFHGLTFAPFLCYEGILPGYVRRYVGEERPDVLVSLANDSWFGDSWEPHQHLNFTRFRAIEHRAPLVRATNTGVSAFVSATGDVEERLGVGEEGVLLREVPIVDRERTLYVRYGYRLPWVFWILALLLWIGALRRPRRA
jgi:apolipoprotein N-acyltransferase